MLSTILLLYKNDTCICFAAENKLTVSLYINIGDLSSAMHSFKN